MTTPTTTELEQREPDLSGLSTDFPHEPGEHGFPDPPDPMFDLTESTCGATWDAQPVEGYDGSGGPSIEFVNANERSTCLLRWITPLPANLNDPARIVGTGRCTGTLIGPNLVLTAAHCLERSQRNPNAWLFDARNNPITPLAAAVLLQADFNFQFAGPALRDLRPVDSFRVLDVLEYRPDGLDIALLRVEGSPGGTYGWREVGERAGRVGDPITIIQHPSGQAKQVDGGTIGSVDEDVLEYTDLDTLPGSSGSGVLDVRSEIIGVHVFGGCNPVLDNDPDQDNDAVRVDRALRASPVLREFTERRPSSSIDTGSGGIYAVAWEQDNDQNGFSEIRAAIGFASGGLSVPEFAVNVNSAGQQRNPSVAVVGGTFVVAWEDDADQNGFYNVYMRGFSIADGSERFGPRLLHTVGAGQQLRPRLAAIDSRRFVAVWEHDPDRNDFYNVRVRGFDNTGQEVIPEFQVHQVGAGQQLRPAVAAGNGRFAVAWQDDRNRDGTYRVCARTFDRDGAPQTEDIEIAPSNMPGQQIDPALAINSEGTIVVTWSDDVDSNSFWNVRMAALDVNGRSVLSPREAHEIGAGNQRRGVPIFTATNQFAVAWEDDQDRNGFTNVLAAGFDLAGNRQWDDRLTHIATAGNQRNPSVAVGDETIVITAESDEQLDGTYGILVDGLRADGSRRHAGDLKIDVR